MSPGSRTPPLSALMSPARACLLPAQAGFILDASRRRLGDAQNVMLLGLFSYFMAIDGATLTCRPPDPAAANSASVPTSYHARIARYRECGHSQMPGWCTDPNLGLPRTVTHPDFPGKRYFKARRVMGMIVVPQVAVTWLVTSFLIK